MADMADLYDFYYNITMTSESQPRIPYWKWAVFGCLTIIQLSMMVYVLITCTKVVCGVFRDRSSEAGSRYSIELPEIPPRRESLTTSNVSDSGSSEDSESVEDNTTTSGSLYINMSGNGGAEADLEGAPPMPSSSSTAMVSSVPPNSMDSACSDLSISIASGEIADEEGSIMSLTRANPCNFNSVMQWMNLLCHSLKVQVEQLDLMFIHWDENRMQRERAFIENHLQWVEKRASAIHRSARRAQICLDQQN